MAKFPFFGRNKEPEAKIVEKPKEKSIPGLGAGFLELYQDRGLVTDKSVSKKLLDAYNGWVYANVRTIASEVSKIEFKLFQTKLTKDGIEFNPIVNHPLLDLLDRFNTHTTTSDAMFMTEAHLKLAGDTFYLLTGASEGANITIGKNIQELYILPPNEIELMFDGPIVSGYKWTYRANDKTYVNIYKPEQIIQFKIPNPKNAYRGQSAVEAGAQAIDLDNLATETITAFFKRGTINNFVLSSEQRVTPEQIEVLKAQFKREYSGVNNAFKALILGSGLKPETIQASNKDTQFIELQQWFRDKIMVLFQNTKISLGITDDVNRANAEESLNAWRENSIKPEMQRIADTLNEFLVPRFGTDLILGFDDPVPENRTEKLDEATKLLDAKVITTNEAREIVEYEPLQGPEFDTIQQNQAPVQIPEIPKAVRNVNYQKVLRRNHIYDTHEIYKSARKIAERVLSPKKAKEKIKEVEKPQSRYFTNVQLEKYWSKQMHIVDVIEKRFLDKLHVFIGKVENRALENLVEIANKIAKAGKIKADLIKPEDYDDFTTAGIDLFTPLQEEIAQLSGDEANKLLKLDTPYIMSADMKKTIKSSVVKFTESMLSTDQDKLAGILSDGLKEGLGIPQIERNIREVFDTFKKTQSERIARTEILRANNNAALDAFKESGVVEGKQWLTAQDGRVDEDCAEYEGVIVGLDRNFYEPEEFAEGDPPLHANCRCIIIPILADTKSVEINELKQKLMQAEAEKTELESYSKQLEGLLADEK